jgi:hypothetical protein
MESEAEILHRWRYLRDLLIDQLGRFESGALRLQSEDLDLSSDAIAKLKRNIQDFDELIARSEARERVRPGAEIGPPPA